MTAETWEKPYPRQRAAWPSKHTTLHKFWPSVGRVNSVLGDRKLICSCPPMEDYA